VEVRGGGDAEGDDEELLALEDGDEGGFVVVVDLDGLDSVGDLALAVWPGQSRDIVLACLQQRFGKRSADAAGGLRKVRVCERRLSWR
jgi:hypothetical protein